MQTRALTSKPIDTEDDEEFTVQEVSNVVQDMGNIKASGEDGIPCEVWKCVGAILPRYISAIYNGCLKLYATGFKWLQSTFAYDNIFARHLNFSTWFTKNFIIPGTKKDLIMDETAFFGK
jgi:hypothetical protein